MTAMPRYANVQARSEAATQHDDERFLDLRLDFGEDVISVSTYASINCSQMMPMCTCGIGHHDFYAFAQQRRVGDELARDIDRITARAETRNRCLQRLLRLHAEHRHA